MGRRKIIRLLGSLHYVMPTRSMKYLKYSYELNVPIDEAFEHMIDVQRLDDNAHIFTGAKLFSSKDEPIGVGKKYVVSANTGNEKVETTLVIERMQRPVLVVISYNYNTVKSDGTVVTGSFLPWESMDCVISLQNNKGSTNVETTMTANGVKTISQLTFARLLSIINWFQQRNANRRVKRYIENLA